MHGKWKIKKLSNVYADCPCGVLDAFLRCGISIMERLIQNLGHRGEKWSI